jgi:hypothetical protein
MMALVGMTALVGRTALVGATELVGTTARALTLTTRQACCVSGDVLDLRNWATW